MDYEKDIINRLRRIEGQVRGSVRLMENRVDCKAVITQLTAIRSAIDKAIAIIVSKNLAQSLFEDLKNGKTTNSTVKEAVELLVKSK